MERRQLRSDPILIRWRAYVAESVLRSDWRLAQVVASRVIERSLSMHFEVAGDRVSIADWSPASGPRGLIEYSEPQCVVNQGRSRNICSSHDAMGHLLRVESLPIHRQLGIEFPRAPAVQDLSDRCDTGAQQVGHRL